MALSLATSLDALAVGMSMALLRVSIWAPAAVIGLVAALLTMVGIYCGGRLGSRWGRWAELAGGVVLLLIGLEMLVSYLTTHRSQRDDCPALAQAALAAPDYRSPRRAGLQCPGLFPRQVSRPGLRHSPGRQHAARRARHSRLQRRGPPGHRPAVRPLPLRRRAGLRRQLRRCGRASTIRPWPGGSTSMAWRTSCRRPCRAASAWSTSPPTWCSPGRPDGGYREDDPIDPVTVYGKTMAEGEQLLVAADPTACILRISLPMGDELQRPCRGHRLDHLAVQEVAAGDALFRRNPHAHLHRLHERTVRSHALEPATRHFPRRRAAAS